MPHASEDSCGDRAQAAGSGPSDDRGYVLRSARIAELLGAPGRTDPAAIDVLSGPERMRFDSSPSPEAGRRFLSGRLLLRSLIAHTASVDPAAVRLRATCPDCGLEHGRVVVREPAEARDLRVSLTHTDERVFAAAAWGRGIGIDVERAESGAERMAAIAEVAGHADSDTGEDPDPIAHWTLIEAVLKADGRGLRVDPRALTIQKWTGGEGIVARVAGDGAYLVQQPRVGDAYRCSVALALAPREIMKAGSGCV